MTPLLCGLCGEEELVLTCEQNVGACQSCQQAAAEQGLSLDGLYHQQQAQRAQRSVAEAVDG